MAQVTHDREPANNGFMCVEPLIFLDDLRALGVRWIDRLIDPCTSHKDVEMVWTLIRMWGPDDEDASQLREMSAQMPQLEDEVHKILAIIRLCENYQS